MSPNRTNMVGFNSCPRHRSSKMDAMEVMNDLQQALKPLIKNSVHDQSATKIYNNKNGRRGNNFLEEQAAFLRDKTPKNGLIIDKSIIDMKTHNTPQNKKHKKQFNMTTDFTVTETDDRFTSDTNFVRPSLIQDRLMSISRTRIRKQPGKSKVPNIYDDNMNIMIKNQESLRNASHRPLMSHYHSSQNQNFDEC